LYLTPRAVSIFWGYALTELWGQVEERAKRGGANNKVDLSLIYNAIYKSKVPSTYKPAEYPLEETGIHRFRDHDFETKLLEHGAKVSVENANHRLCRRLEYFFEKDKQYRNKICAGAYYEFVDKQRLMSIMAEIAEKLAVMRISESLMYSPESVKGKTWSLEDLLLAARVEKKRTLKRSLIIIDRNLSVVSLGRPYFEEIQSNSHYLAHREKILRLKIEPDKFKSVAPCLHLNINDFMILRNLLSIECPDLALHPQTKLKINAFFNALNDIGVYYIKPRLYRCILERVEKNIVHGLQVLTLDPYGECDVEIVDGKLRIRCGGEVIYER
jgi:hypothetical protein